MYSISDNKNLAADFFGSFTNGDVDSVYLAFNAFKSVMVQHVVVEQLLPIPRGAFEAPSEPAGAVPGGGAPVEYLYEPAPEELFKHLLPTYVEV